MRGQTVVCALTAYDHLTRHQAKINSHPAYVTTRSGPEPLLVNKATWWWPARLADLAGYVLRPGLQQERGGYAAVVSPGEVPAVPRRNTSTTSHV